MVTVEGGTTKKPIILLYRDGLEVFKFLFGNPIFKGYQEHVPRHMWEDETCNMQFFGEPNTGDFVFEIQVSCFSSLVTCIVANRLSRIKSIPERHLDL